MLFERFQLGDWDLYLLETRFAGNIQEVVEHKLYTL